MTRDGVAKTDHEVSSPAKKLSLAQLELAGKRAKDRRKKLKLNRKDLTSRAGIAQSKIVSWEKSIPQTIKAETIKAWELALKVPDGWLLNLDMDIPVSSMDDFKSDDIRTAADEIRKIGCWAARQHGNKTIDIGQLTESEARMAKIFALRYGVASEDASTLQAIGNTYGLTRERVRQILEKTTKNLHVDDIRTPVIDVLFRKIMASLPVSIVDLDQKFSEQLGESLSVVGLNRFLNEILGREDIQITDKPSGMSRAWSKVAVNSSTHSEARLCAIRDASFEMIRSCGGAQLNWVAGTVSSQCDEAVTTQNILRECRMIDGFKWLSEEDGWFWFGEMTPADNRVLLLTKKMLAVAGRRLDVEDVQQGLSRARRFHYYSDKQRPVMVEPTSSVIVAILSQVSWIKVIQSDDFVLDPVIPVEDVLSDSELEIYHLMLAAGGVMSRHDINRGISNAFSDAMLSNNLDNSPIFSRLEVGIYILRGRPINIAAMQRAMKSVGGSTLMPIEQSGENISFQITLTNFQIKNNYIGIGAKAAPHLENGEYSIDGFDTKARYAAKSRRLYNLTQIMTEVGYVAGDPVTIQIYPGEKRIRISSQKQLQHKIPSR